MSVYTRVASFAMVTLCAAAMICTTSPGFAFDLSADRPGITTNNVAYPTQVPIPPAPIVPPEWTLEQGEAPRTLAANRDSTEYASLSHAVAAQGIPDQPDRELHCLATGVYFESKGEPLTGQLAVAEVILNRAQSGRYPATACSVLTQRGQFSFVRRGRLPSVPTASSAWKTAVAIAKVARDEVWESKASNAMFFHARHVSPRWNRSRVASLGNHIFYR